MAEKKRKIFLQNARGLRGVLLFPYGPNGGHPGNHRGLPFFTHEVIYTKYNLTPTVLHLGLEMAEIKFWSLGLSPMVATYTINFASHNTQDHSCQIN